MRHLIHAKLKHWYCSDIQVCTDWKEVGEKLTRIGSWEFEDYQEYKK